MRAIDFAIMTVARPTNYIHELIDSLRPDLPVRLVAGSPDYGYLERYRSNPYREIVEVPDKGWEHFHDRPVRHKACWNYWRCLTLGPRSPESEGLLILEDDVTPARGWENRFYETVDQIKAVCDGPFVLALYSPVRLPRTPDSRTYYVPYPTPRFYGTQAMYFPEEVRAGFTRFLRAYGVNTIRHPYDILLRIYLLNVNIPLFAAKPCLFQHVGEVGTGLGKFHKTRQFNSDVSGATAPARSSSNAPADTAVANSPAATSRRRGARAA
jgi:hypothetical protein